jgi:CTP synthase (UTP-ammonia lyase)
MTASKIALLGEFSPTFPPHPATSAALEHACGAAGLDIAGEWVSTADVDEDLLAGYSGIWVAPGSPYKDMSRTLRAIRLARDHGIPCFGTCGGFQHMVIEYARHVLHFADAQHAEYDPDASRLFISALQCSLLGRTMALRFQAGSRVAGIYGSHSAEEEYYCNFGVNPGVVPLLRAGGLQITGSDEEGEVRVIELAGHPFFIATLFVPQMRSTPSRPHPLVTAFVRAVAGGPGPA